MNGLPYSCFLLVQSLITPLANAVYAYGRLKSYKQMTETLLAK